MSNNFTIKRTSSDEPHFRELVRHLDNELWNELNEDQATYDQYNKVPGLNTVIIVYEEGKPVAIGCFKEYNADTVEIKRMFVEKECRGRGLSKMLLKALEEWAEELGFSHSILETSVHFSVARRLYSGAGYAVTGNYDQYRGLADSVCMKKQLNPLKGNNTLTAVEYFLFEKDFVEKNIRCIPMIVRFKMDHAGIKLKLAEWSKFSVAERVILAEMPISNGKAIRAYHDYLAGLVNTYTGKEPARLCIEETPIWSKTDEVPGIVMVKLKDAGSHLSIKQWKGLTVLQRFALVKLSREGHESKNFPKALKEFGVA